MWGGVDSLEAWDASAIRGGYAVQLVLIHYVLALIHYVLKSIHHVGITNYIHMCGKLLAVTCSHPIPIPTPV
jgi:hypothetical protein